MNGQQILFTPNIIDKTEGFPIIFTTITINPNITWLTIDYNTGTIWGIPSDDDVGKKFTVTMKISNTYKEDYSDSFSFTVNGSLSYWLRVISKYIGFFGIIPTIWYLRDEIHNILLCRKNYKYPDIDVKANEKFVKII